MLDRTEQKLFLELKINKLLGSNLQHLKPYRLEKKLFLELKNGPCAGTGTGTGTRTNLLNRPQFFFVKSDSTVENLT